MSDRFNRYSADKMLRATLSFDWASSDTPEQVRGIVCKDTLKAYQSVNTPDVLDLLNDSDSTFSSALVQRGSLSYVDEVRGKSARKGYERFHHRHHHRKRVGLSNRTHRRRAYGHRRNDNCHWDIKAARTRQAKTMNHHQ